MGRGIDVDLDWPTIKQLGKGLWLVDTGSRIRIRQRRRFTTRKEADAFAAEIRTGYQIDGRSALTEQQKHEFKLAVSTLGHLHKKVSLVDVVNYYLTMKGATGRSENVAKAVTLFVDSRKKKSPRYHKQLDFVLTEFSKNFGGRKPNEVTKDELESFILGKRMNKKDPTKQIALATRHNLYRAIRLFYAFCHKRQWIFENPMDSVTPPDPATYDPKILTIDDVEKVLTYVQNSPLHRDMLGFMALGFFCGVRVQELCRIRISDINLTAYDLKHSVLISPRVSKTKRARNIPIPWNCYMWLMEWLNNATIPVSRNSPQRRRLDDNDWVRPVSEASIFYRTKEIAKGSGVPLPQNVMRHSFASYYYEATRDAEQTRYRLGHNTPSMLFAHYRQLVLQSANGRSAIDYFKVLPKGKNFDLIVRHHKVPLTALSANNTDTSRLLNLL
jgi:integrase